jgi:prepilin-type N-terminal cleavage/methylation domain-containing protein
MTGTRCTTDRLDARRGFTLVELMVVMIIVGVMVAMSAPSFQRAIEQSRADIAVANLRAVWAAERLYWLENHVYTPSIGTLQSMGVLDVSIPSDTTDAIAGYTYQITDATDSTMTATATRTNGAGSFSVDASGSTSGSITAGGTSITPGYQ